MPRQITKKLDERSERLEGGECNQPEETGDGSGRMEKECPLMGAPTADTAKELMMIYETS